MYTGLGHLLGSDISSKKSRYLVAIIVLLLTYIYIYLSSNYLVITNYLAKKDQKKTEHKTQIKI